MLENMEKSLQQRIVGAIVLVALGVILIPALLDGSGYKSRHERSIEIPEKPVLPTLEEVKVEPVALATPIDTRREQVEEKEKVIPQAPIQSWALQVGTFSQEENALAFRDTLRKEGYTSYVDTAESDGKKSYRVRIGPELEKDRLEKLRAKFKSQKNINGFIVNHH